MGLMKRFLMDKISEFADLHGLSEELIYSDTPWGREWYALACKYADIALKALHTEKHDK